MRFTAITSAAVVGFGAAGLIFQPTSHVLTQSGARHEAPPAIQTSDTNHDRNARVDAILSGGGCVPDWVPTFGGEINEGVYSLAVHDDGSGPALYAGGLFTSVGGVVVNRVAKWNGASWSPLGSGANDWVFALIEYDDGSGPALYAGGQFTEIGGKAINYLAKWDGQEWSDVGGGMNNRVRALAVYDDGSGPALIVGGDFVDAGGLKARRIAKWDGKEWSRFHVGMDDSVWSLCTYDDGTGTALYAGGEFGQAGFETTYSIAKWNGSSWSAVGGGMNSTVNGMVVFDDGNGAALYATGDFLNGGGMILHGIGRWDGTSWSTLGEGLGDDGLSDDGNTLAVYDDGSGPALYVGGQFTVAGGITVNRIAKWDGKEWSALGEGVGSSVIHQVRALITFDDGTGPALFVGGRYTSSPAGDSHLAKYQGCGPTTSPAPLVDFNIAFGSLIDGGLNELIDSDDARLHARSGIGFSALEPNVLELRIGAISPNVDAGSINATIEASINNPNGAASVRLRDWSTNQFEEVHVYTIGVTETTEQIEQIDATNHIRASDGRIELAHKIIVVASFSAIGFDAYFDQIELTVSN